MVSTKHFIIKKLDWRYKKGIPSVCESEILLGDSTIELQEMARKIRKKNKYFSLLFTSPPYCSVTDYHADQWLRLWLLGGPEIPQSNQEKHKGRFVCREDYYALLDNVFGHCATMMSEKSVVYVRTDKREFTFSTTLEILKKYFPSHSLEITDKPFKNKTQTAIHGNSSKVSGEVDIIMYR